MPETTDTRWRCPGCGSDEIEGLAWVRLNGETVESWDENSEYWCPKCEEHIKHICAVNVEGYCLLHECAFEECRSGGQTRLQLPDRNPETKGEKP